MIPKPAPIGEKFGRLTVIKELPPKIYPTNEQRRILCRCDCGNFSKTWLTMVTRGCIKSCGCLNLEAKIEAATTHGMRNHPLYIVFRAMQARCYNEKHVGYHNYGGRGITICKSWLEDRSKFFEWALSHGWEKGLRIERIDNDKGYSPSNCKFATALEQGSNKRSTKFYKFKGELLTIAEISRLVGIKYSVLHHRLHRGETLKEAIK